MAQKNLPLRFATCQRSSWVNFSALTVMTLCASTCGPLVSLSALRQQQMQMTALRLGDGSQGDTGVKRDQAASVVYSQGQQVSIGQLPVTQ